AGFAIKLSTSWPAASGALLITLITPAGNPASRITAPSRYCVPGQSSDDLRTTVFPQANGSAIARAPKITGAFHGAMPRTTPTGSRTQNAKHPGLLGRINSPAHWG